MDKKKLSSGLKMTGFWLSLATLLMFFAPGVTETITIPGTGSFELQPSMFEYMFKTGSMYDRVVYYNGVYIAAFVVALLAIVALGYVFVTNIIGKANVKLNKYLIIGSIVCLLSVAVFGFCAGVCMKGELYRMTELPEAILKEALKTVHLKSGAIVPAIFGIIGGGSLIGSLVLDK